MKKVNIKYYYTIPETLIILVDNRIILCLRRKSLKRITRNTLLNIELNDVRVDSYDFYDFSNPGFPLFIGDDVIYGISSMDLYKKIIWLIKYSDKPRDPSYRIKDLLRGFNKLYYEYKHLVKT